MTSTRRGKPTLRKGFLADDSSARDTIARHVSPHHPAAELYYRGLGDVTSRSEKLSDSRGAGHSRAGAPHHEI